MPSIPTIIPLSSAGTGNRLILVTATATAGTLIHTAVSGTTNFHEVFLYAVNNSASDVLLTIEWGGVTSTADLIRQTIPFQDGMYVVGIPGGMVNNGLLIRAFAGTGSVISIGGWAKSWVVT